MRNKVTRKRPRKNRNPIPVVRKRKNTLPFKKIQNRAAPPPSNPLVGFLGESPDDVDSRLWQIAQQLSQKPFDAKRFRADLLLKLRRVPYSEPRDPDRR